MGRKAKWFGAVKKVFSPDSKQKKSKEKKLKNNHGSNNWGGIEQQFKDSSYPSSSESLVNSVASSAPPPPPLPLPQPRGEDFELAAVENEQSKHSNSVVVHSAAHEEAAVPPSPASAVIVPHSVPARFTRKSKEEFAAIRIQTAFRGYLARRALCALRGLVRLRSLIHGNACTRQATTTLRCMQTLARVQSQIRSRRIRMLEENQALQRQLLMKREKELECLKLGEEWDDSLQSKEQIEASLLSKQEAAIRRERAMAYAFTHQGKNSSRSTNPMFMDPNNPQWGWSWLERWTAARPWESRSTTTTTDKDLNSDRASVKSSAALSVSTNDEITKAYYAGQKSLRTLSRLSPSTPQSKPPTSLKIKSASPRMGWAHVAEDDARRMMGMKSERHRRHSIGGLSVGDDESLTSSPAVPSYMAPTESARARSRLQRPSNDVIIEGIEKVSAGFVKKRLSFSAGSAGPRRHSGPPKVDMSSVKDVTVPVGE